MKYQNISVGRFLKRPNRFIAEIELNGKAEIVHVKNTGRCAELLVPGAEVYVQKADNDNRSTKWDLIGVKKGTRMINMDSQIPNVIVGEWLRESSYFPNITQIRPEMTYGESRLDYYIEYDEKKAFLEVKGVTLEENGVVMFPDAPSERAVRHLRELERAVQEGYEAYVFFVIQMKSVTFMKPNDRTHQAFADALREVTEAGVKVLAYDCDVTADAITIADPVPVVLNQNVLPYCVAPLLAWFQKEKRDLPWRQNVDAYRVWISEIMLQQTRVEAVKPYFKRFLDTLPNIHALAEAPEDVLLKLWEGLGYYNRVRNMQKAAIQVETEYQGRFPETYEEIRNLSGIGNYTAGAIGSIAFGIPKPAVDGNVLRVVSRILASHDDIMKASVRKKYEQMIEKVIPIECPGDFNQSLIELGAIVCVPNGEPKCEKCPVAEFCEAKARNLQTELPIKTKAKARKIEEKTVLILRDGEALALRKRPQKGLLAGLYEFPMLEGKCNRKEVIDYCKSIGLSPLHVKKLCDAKHIFSHIEWHMTGYEVRVDELEKNCVETMIFAKPKEIQQTYSMPAAFDAYSKLIIGLKA